MHISVSTRLVVLLAVLLMALLPVAFGTYVNASSPAPTSRLLPGRCSRYCEAHDCPHATPANSPAYFRLRPLYAATVRGLAAGGRQYYAVANIAFYLVLIPFLLLWLTYGALRNMVLIRRLKGLRRG
jgi:hypothetical protein